VDRVDPAPNQSGKPPTRHGGRITCKTGAEGKRSKMSTSSEQSSVANDAMHILTVTLTAGIGIPFARCVAPLIWPGLDDAWGVRTVNLVSIIGACAIVSLALWGAGKLFGKRKAAGFAEKTPPSA
jgi:hypothetical protein